MKVALEVDAFVIMLLLRRRSAVTTKESTTLTPGIDMTKTLMEGWDG